MPRQRYSKDQLKTFCQHFWSFLEERQLINEPTTREKLRDVYNREFKPHSTLRLPCYSMIIFNMKRFRFIQIRDKEYVHFCKSPRNKSSKSSKASPNDSCSSGSSQSAQNKLPSGSQKKFTQQVTLSVDQHLALKNSPQKKSTSNLASDETFSCTICNIYFYSELLLELHKLNNGHKLNLLKAKLDYKKELLINNIYNVNIYADGALSIEDEGQIKINIKAGEMKHIMISIHNEDKTSVNLIRCQALQYVSTCCLDDPRGVTIKTTSVQIQPDDRYQILVKYHSLVPGEEEIPLNFLFIKDKEQFNLIRYLMLNVVDDLSNEIKAVAPYKPPPRASVEIMGSNIIPGLPLDKDCCEDELERIIKLQRFNIPSSLRTLVNHGLKHFQGITKSQAEELRRVKNLLKGALSSETHKSRFQTLVYFEEIQMEVDIRCYDMEEVTMDLVKENAKLLSLKVPGLAENRPSVLKGDRLYIQQSKAFNKEYEGVVHNVRELEVWLGFSSRFREEFIKNQHFNVRFTFNRLPLRLQHQALNLCDELSLNPFLFPEGKLVAGEKSIPTEIRLFNKILYNNDEQVQAIKTIVSGCSGSNPYIIFGPPGTGKTVTLVEAMKQVANKNKNSHILACAPSNTAADLITKRLLAHISQKDVFRMIAMSRDWTKVPNDIKDVCNYNARTRKYFYPSKEKLMKFQFIITTLVTAGRLVAANFPSMHFTHVFIDEAGHATEPETLIAVAGMLENLSHAEHCGQLILTGDPKQLGPVLRSPFAIRYGLGISLMERLMLKCDIYKRQEEGYNPQFITKLLRNYRSHPNIISVPNELFYDNELQACADELIRNKFCYWEGLPQKQFPLIFHGVIGKDEQEARSPSFFNISEVSIIMDYVIQLLSCRSINVKPTEIGIIAPYNQQVRKIRKALQDLGKKKHKVSEIQGKDPTEITVGSTEEFQGQERLVILISTVRSSPHLLEYDGKFRLGFIRNAKRFNVAITRAKALLIAVGNPHILRLDANWNRLMEYCSENGSCKGVPPVSTGQIDEMITRLGHLNLDQDVTVSLDNDNLMFTSTVNDEQQWRSDL